MDALALLCNLYGDGPATLKRLRAHGVQRIEDLGSRQAGDLATLLALTPAIARRFLKEASALEKRVLEGDERRAPAARVVARVAAPAPAVQLPPREVVRGKQAVLAAAAQRWGELDRAAPAVSETEPARVLEPEPCATTGTPLAVAELDRATLEALERAGIRTLEELAGQDTDRLAAVAGLGISQVLFAQGLARREARAQVERAQRDQADAEAEELVVCVLQPPVRQDPRFSPSERPADAWLSDAQRPRDTAPDEGAGPFA